MATGPLKPPPGFAPDLGVRHAAAWVTERASLVRIESAALEALAQRLAQTEAPPLPAWDTAIHLSAEEPGCANWLLLLDALNFCFWGEPRWTVEGAGETLRGYRALAFCLARATREGLPLTEASFLAELSLEQLQEVLQGSVEIPLLAERLTHAHQVGRVLQAQFQGDFAQAISACQGSGLALAALVAEHFPYADRTEYLGRELPVLKRAQILVADLHGAYGGQGLGRFKDRARLTAFADYKVPQVLHHEGVLRYHPTLEAKLRQGVELAPHSVEEVELRLVAVEAVERLQAAMAAKGRPLMALEVDWLLWEAGRFLPPEALPHHRTRTTAY